MSVVRSTPVGIFVFSGVFAYRQMEEKVWKRKSWCRLQENCLRKQTFFLEVLSE
jgi:hypothetical protein